MGQQPVDRRTVLPGAATGTPLNPPGVTRRSLSALDRG